VIENVTACLVTRGDQPEKMEAIRRSLSLSHVVTWDNSQRDDWKCAGRYMAALQLAETRAVYFQDDDVIVPRETQDELLERYWSSSAEIVANWGHGENPDGYEDLPLVCGGAVTNVDAILRAMLRYAEHWPLDDEFKYEADFAIGVLYDSFEHVHLPFEIDYEIAQSPERLCNQPWQRALKRKITDRARWIRAARAPSEAIQEEVYS